MMMDCWWCPKFIVTGQDRMSSEVRPGEWQMFHIECHNEYEKWMKE